MAKEICISDIKKSEKLKEKMISEILAGKIFIYPTDTIYGLGCNALNEKAVEKIREIKYRDSKPFSIIAPSFDFISENFILKYNIKKYLPGAYTLILEKKKKILEHVNKKTLGIRIPKHEFVGILKEAKVPFITTSVNISGKPFAKNLDEIDKAIIEKVDYIIKGKVKGVPSTIISLDGSEVKRN